MHKFSSMTHQFVSDLFGYHFFVQTPGFLTELFTQVDSLFAGNYPGYQRSDTVFHDLHHTCDATEATARLLDGHIKGGNPPMLTARDAELAIAAVLLHDTGYIKKVGDNDGTGAKYTLTHIDRSAEFAGLFLPNLKVTPNEVLLVQTAIHCTGVNFEMSRLNFRTPAERYIGCAVGTADILSQMAATDYPIHLPELYEEYKEAVAYSKSHTTGLANYRSVEDLMRRTRGFYEKQVRHLLEKEWDGVYHDLEYHYGNGANLYLTAIELNLQRIDRFLVEENCPAAR
jgi:hypothetical protein